MYKIFYSTIPYRKFSLKILMTVPVNDRIRKKLEVNSIQRNFCYFAIVLLETFICFYLFLIMVDKKTLLTNILNFLCKYNNNAEDAYYKKLLLNLSRKLLLLLTLLFTYLLRNYRIIELSNYFFRHFYHNFY